LTKDILLLIVTTSITSESKSFSDYENIKYETSSENE